MPAADLVVRGAREHNLCDVDLVLPRNKLICLTGVSGSGKSSLAFDTLYAEGQRRYVESLSTFARQFLGQMPKPDVDFIGGLSPSISISQKTSGRNPRSTVGTITEIYDYLRVLYARTGQGHCPVCERPITAQSREQIIGTIMAQAEGTRFMVLALLIRGQKGEYRDLFDDLLKQGFVRARVDGQIVSLTDDLSLDRQMRHDIEVVVDRLTAGPKSRTRVAEAVEIALRMGEGNLIIAPEAADRESSGWSKPPTTSSTTPSTPRRSRGGLQPGDTALSADFACTHCSLSFAPPSPQLFSFNSPHGMCESCDGLGEFFSFDPETLATEPDKTFKQGCLELIGKWKDLGRWRRHIYQGVADTMERTFQLPAGTFLETPWRELDLQLRDLLLWGTGETHITFTWRAGSAGQKYGGQYEGIIPDLVSKYGSAKSKPQINRLERFMRVICCPDCQGERLNPQARAVTITSASPRFSGRNAMSLPQVCHLPVSDAVEFFSELEMEGTRAIIAAEALKEIRGRLGFLENVGLDYLSLERTAPTLSGGESQRIRLAGQIGCGLVGVLYILDEPSIGLHPRDNDRLLSTLGDLRDLGNTVIVVEHDEDTMRAADHIIDFGPGPGVRGGKIVALGTADDVAGEKQSVTGAYLSGEKKIAVPPTRRPTDRGRITVVGASHNNLKDVDVEIPLGAFVCITGVSGSGKSSLVNGILVEALRRDLNGGKGEPGLHKKIESLDQLDKLIAIDQSPIGRTPRSNPGTYIKVFDDIRNLFAQLPESKKRGYKPGRFSFNVRGGRCEACEGNGSNKLEMDFLADVWVTCPICEGHRFSRETLQVRFKGKSIADVLEMDVQQALTHFENIPAISHKLQTLHDVGLDYVKIGQPSPTLSGGEAQRIKLARELVKKSTGRTLYLLDEPTTGLHFADIEMLLKVLHSFVDAGNTVLVVEHNLDVVKTADWIIDLGPEGGAAGGQIVATGTPEQLAKSSESYTGRSLRPLLNGRVNGRDSGQDRAASDGQRKKTQKKSSARNAPCEITHIVVEGARQHNLKDIDVRLPRDQMTVFCGPSGSGKSSLAMDTIYAEGQRRYVESLSSYARQFVGQMQKPRVDHIEGLSPAIAIEQRNVGHTPRSTVGTVTEIYDYLRILFARLGEAHCPDCDVKIGTQTGDEIVDKILTEPAGTKLYLMAPIDIEVGQTYEMLWDEIRAAGYMRMRVDGKTCSVDEPPKIDRRRRHKVEVVVDRMSARSETRSRMAESVEAALALGQGVLHVAYPRENVPEPKWPVKVHSQHFACDGCGRSFLPLTPHSFSFNSQLGWCRACEGLGTQTGANPAALVRQPDLTLAEGALLLWPSNDQPMFQTMLAALSAHANLPIDVPYERLNAKQRRTVLYGTGDEWIDVFPTGRRTKNTRQLFRFQYKGLYPALDEASRMSQALRARLEHLVDEIECSECGGSRLCDDTGATRFQGSTIDQICRTPLGELLNECQRWELSKREQKVAGELVREICNRLQFLVDVGLDYLTIGRSAPTLSGGEAQRIRLASQVGSGLCGVLYVLDEPTIGLHPRDNRRLIGALEKLRDLGNTLLVVEHDREVVRGADYLVDFGPAAGRHGGQIVAEGTPKQVARSRTSVTGPYLSGKKAIPVPTNRRMPCRDGASQNGKRRAKNMPAPRVTEWLEIIGARHNNLQNIDVQIPLAAFTAVTGVSGSGKSSLIENILYSQLAKTLHRARTFPGAHDKIRGVKHVNKVIRVDQQPLGNTPTSNPATYTGVFELIRQLFAQLPEAKLRGYAPRRFSFNVAGGRCDACDGAGQLCIEMHFLPDVWVECDTCHGKRYNEETLAVRYHGRSIADVLDMPCGEAARLFENVPKIRRILQTLCDVGLDYLTLGQSAPTLSGGEAQRVKLASELSRPDTGRTLYLLDEPTTGLHFDDLAKLLDVLNRLVDLGNTVVVIEHNLDVIKTADWVIDMGPEAGEGGGQIVFAGTPEEIVAYAEQSKPRRAKKAKTSSAGSKSREKKPAAAAQLRSYTGEVLAEVLKAGPHRKRQTHDFAEAQEKRSADLEITEVGRDTKMPWEIDGRRWHTRDRVGRDGQPCQWDGKILDRVEQRIQELAELSSTSWNARSVVKVVAKRKSDGWFMHALTGETWLLKLKFRVAKNTFKRDALIADLGLKPLNDLEELPVYGRRQRVRCKNLRGPWQEVQIDAHSWNEIDTREFWSFLEQAVAGFCKLTDRIQQKPEDVMPWKVLGQKWHVSRRGFPLGKKVIWESDILEELCELLAGVAPEAQFLWNNQQVVHVMVREQRTPWAILHTKRPDGLDLVLNGPKGQFALGRVANLAADRQLDSADVHDVVKLRFRTAEDVASGDLPDFLAEHLASVKENNGAVTTLNPA